MNSLNIIGNLTADPQSRNVNDKTVCSFTVAVNRRGGQNDKDGKPLVDFFRVNAWNKLGENCQKFLSKGKKVGVSGSVSAHAYAGNDGSPKASIEVFATDVEFLTPTGSQVQPNMTPVDSDNLPF